MSPARKPKRKKVAAKRVKPPARKKAAAKRAKPKLRVLRRKPARLSTRRRPRRAMTPAFPQAAGASPKQRLLFELVRARTAVGAALQGVTGGNAEVPTAPGKWSVREVVLHLVARDRIRLRELEAALRGVTPSWYASTPEQDDRNNREHIDALRHHLWDDALRQMHATRAELMEAIESVPEQPAEVWEETHPFGWMMLRLPAHDQHHAQTIKAWRMRSRI